VFLKTTKELILDASIKVFSEKGYLSATTLEISKVAGVSEMTLFRQFQTKNNLFLTSVKQAMGDSLMEEINLNVDDEISDFTMKLLHEKLNIISTHITLIRMLIRESLSNTLPEELEFTKVIYSQVVQKITYYIKHHDLTINPIFFAEMVVGLLLRYAVMEDNPAYHLWDKDQQISYLESYWKIFNI